MKRQKMYWKSLQSVFFFSSRRRHTRLQGDWSSDVCSSDLSILALIFGYVARSQIRQRGQSGDGMAIAGIVLGWIGVATLILVIVVAVSVDSSFSFSG